MTQLALCMIARDEQDFLPDCLASVAGVVDEIVLVDTGSRDRTVAIARAAGAKVVQHTWSDDFAAARNAALPATNCEWILVLDADERLAAGAGYAIKQALLAPDFDCGFLPLYNAQRLACSPAEVLASPAARYDEPSVLPRLLRNTEDLRWQGRVHESVAAWLVSRPHALRQIAAPIVHYGYTLEVGLQRGKKQRNLTLLEGYCAQEPDNPIPWTYLAWELMTADDSASSQRAAAAADSGWSALQAAAAGMQASEIGIRLPSPVALASVRALYALRNQHLAEVHDTLRQAEAWGAQHPNLLLLQAVLAERQADDPQLSTARRHAFITQACERYAHCLELHGRLFSDWLIDGATSWYAATGLGLCLLELTEAKAALHQFDAALQVRSQHVPALLGRAEALILLGRAEPALAALLPVLENAAVQKHADGWLLAALACVQLGALTDRATFLQRAALALAAGGGVDAWRDRRVRARIAAADRPHTASKPARSAKRRQ